MTITNLTPHPVVVLRDDPNGEVTGFTGVGAAQMEGRFTLVGRVAPAGTVARAAQTDEVVGSLEIGDFAVPLVTSRYGEPTDLPASEDGTFYVVSILTAQAAKSAGRSTSDLLVTSDPVRDAVGKIIGCRKFAIV